MTTPTPTQTRRGVLPHTLPDPLHAILLATLSDLGRSLPPGVTLTGTLRPHDPHDLHPPVWDSVGTRLPPLPHTPRHPIPAHAPPRRPAAYRAGRTSAAQALALAGHTGPAPLLPGPHRAPLWPAGFTGSVTHAAGLVLAVAGPVGWQLGIDTEALTPDLHASGLTARDLLTHVLRECAFKATFPARGQPYHPPDFRFLPDAPSSPPTPGQPVQVHLTGFPPLPVHWTRHGAHVSALTCQPL